MENNNCDKLLIAILQNDDYREIIKDLNENGYYVTVLNSSGGFLKKPNATIMIGLNHEKLDDALEILKRYGKRTEMQYGTPAMGLPVSPFPIGSVPIPLQCGGVIVFVIDVSRNERY